MGRSKPVEGQSYCDLEEVGLEEVGGSGVALEVNLCRVVVLMSSIPDLGHCEKIRKASRHFGTLHYL